MSPAEVDQRSKNKVIELLMWRFKGAGRGKVKVDVVRGQQRLYVLYFMCQKSEILFVVRILDTH